jgi:hypothetical protein
MMYWSMKKIPRRGSTGRRRWKRKILGPKLEIENAEEKSVFLLAPFCFFVDVSP